MGVDSTACLLRLLFDPTSRDFDLADLTVICACTGDEWEQTHRHVEEHILPLLRERRIRFVQLSRGGYSQADGVAVLDDSREPRTSIRRGPWSLSADLARAGVVPLVSGGRRCSQKAKAWPITTWLQREIGDAPHRVIFGFESGEQRRADEAVRYDSNGRESIFPLIAWGWDRQDCEHYIDAKLGIGWRKSACTQCPFALTNKRGRTEGLARMEASPREGAAALLLERRAIALNPRAGLVAGERLAHLARAQRRQPLLDAFTALLARTEHAIYDVRRFAPERGMVARSVKILDFGPAEAMHASLEAFAAARHVPVDHSDDVPRAWMLRRGDARPWTEHFLVAGPAGAVAKERGGFAAGWAAATHDAPCGRPAA